MNDKQTLQELGQVMVRMRANLGSIRFFDPSDVDPKDWVRIMRESGFTPELEDNLDTLASAILDEDN